MKIDDSVVSGIVDTVAGENVERYHSASHGRVMFFGDNISPRFETSNLVGRNLILKLPGKLLCRIPVLRKSFEKKPKPR